MCVKKRQASVNSEWTRVGGTLLSSKFFDVHLFVWKGAKNYEILAILKAQAGVTAYLLSSKPVFLSTWFSTAPRGNDKSRWGFAPLWLKENFLFCRAFQWISHNEIRSNTNLSPCGLAKKSLIIIIIVSLAAEVEKYCNNK